MIENKLPESVQRTIENGQAAYKKLIDEKKFTYHTIDIDCSSLPDTDWKNYENNAAELEKILSQLPQNDRPALYYFEILAHDTTNILNTYINFIKNSPNNHRAAVALKKYPPLGTGTLYVGKVKVDMRGRLFVHLGYYHVPRTAGLQLICWAKEIGLKLKLHLYSFEPEMRDFVTALELPFAHEKNPLFGKH